MRVFSRNAWLFLAGSFLMSIAIQVLVVMRNLYFKEAGFSESFIGNALAVFTFGSAVGSIPAAILIARRRTRSILLWSTLLASAGYMGIASTLSAHGILGASLAGGAMTAVYYVAGAPFLMANSAPGGHTWLLSSNFAVRTAAGILGSAGAAQAYSLAQRAGSTPMGSCRAALYMAAIVALLALVPFWFIREEGPPTGQLRLQWSLVRERGWLYGRLALPYIVLGLGAGLTIPFLNLYFHSRFDQSSDSIGYYFAVMHVCITGAIMAGPGLARRFGLVRTIVVSELLSVPLMVVLAYTTSLTVAVGAFVVRGMFMNMAQPLATSFSMQIVSEAEQPLVNSLAQTAWLGSWVASAAVGGAVIELTGYAPPLLASAGFYVASAALYFVFFRSYETATETAPAVAALASDGASRTRLEQEH